MLQCKVYNCGVGSHMGSGTSSHLGMFLQLWLQEASASHGPDHDVPAGDAALDEDAGAPARDPALMEHPQDDEDDGFSGGPLFPLEPVAAAKRRGRPKAFLRELRVDRAAPRAHIAALPLVQEPHVHHLPPAAGLQLHPPVPKVEARHGVFMPSHPEYFHLPSLISVCRSVQKAIAQEGLEVDPDYIKISESMLDSNAYHLSSGVLLAKSLSMDRAVMTRKLRRFAAALLVEHILYRYEFEQAVVSSIPQAGLVHYLDQATYDETSKLAAVPHVVQQHVIGERNDNDSNILEASWQWAQKICNKRKRYATNERQGRQLRKSCRPRVDVAWWYV